LNDPSQTEKEPHFDKLSYQKYKETVVGCRSSRESDYVVIPSLKRDYRPLEIYRVAFIELQFPNVVVKMKRISTMK